ncbi:MAG: aminodeoxychorismate/anthranilate synthase component II [Candidatus Gastranaerophilales bacterium]|nr:aminodeoxychorismate/anthranilate synthase component II [Candidatus Gastranaerophilales bacterium]
MILIDNYDSFTYNIVQYLLELGCEPKVFKNDEITANELKKIGFKSIIISPGPGNPDTAGISLKVAEEFYKTKKILGVCLGHQCIAQFFGAKITKAHPPVHGKTSEIFFKENKLFKGLQNGFQATRYHSLAVENIPDVLENIAQTKDGVNMAIKHKEYPVYGVQFHPESILTQDGKLILQNFLEM